MALYSFDRISILTPNLQYMETAAKAGFTGVSFLVNAGAPMLGLEPVVVGTPHFRDVQAAMAASGLKLTNGEVSPVAPGGPTDDEKRAIDSTAALGGSVITVTYWGNHSDEEAAANIRPYARYAASAGIGLSIEFMAPGITPGVTSALQASRIIDLSGESNIGITADMLHLTRGGTRPEDLDAIPAGRFAYIQLCDGPRTMPLDRQLWEGGSHRLLPGDGEFDIAGYLAHLPRDIPVGIECPHENVDPEAHAMACAAKGRVALDAAGWPSR